MRLVEYTDPAAGFGVRLPEGWERADDTPGVALVTVEPDQGARFRSNVVVTTEQLPRDTTLEAWGQGSDELLDQVLHRYLRLDDEPVEIGGLPARRTLAHHTSEDGFAVTMEQWMLVTGGRGYTLTASVGTLDYNQTAEVFSAVAGSFRPGPEAAR